MKTLDEVIKAFEDTYENDPIAWTYGVDALEYLKKLKRIEAKIEKIAIGNVEDTLSKMDNPPLTWDELKAMEGEPVWIEYDGYKPMWDIVDKIINKRTIETYKCMLHEEDIGIYWQAYRKEN